MRIEQRHWDMSEGWRARVAGEPPLDAHLVLVFGCRSAFADPSGIAVLRARYPAATMFGCSTAGEIVGTRVFDQTLVATAVRFDRTRVRLARVDLADAAGSESAGEAVARELAGPDLVHVVVLSEGLHVNGSALVAGLTRSLPPHVAVTGGLSGDGDRFEETIVLAGDVLRGGQVAAVGLYGDALTIGYGSMGGWDQFGPDRVVTRSSGNVLHELDGRPALELYRRYLGPHADGLPSSGLLFPLSLRSGGSHGVVRTILGIDEESGSMTFAGDIPQGAVVRLMKANFDRLLDGATGAATTCHEAIGGRTPELALLISCVGRKLVLKQRVEEEVESVRDVLGQGAVLAGFYSYGEISPFTPSARCELHNQTMTITTLSER